MYINLDYLIFFMACCSASEELEVRQQTLQDGYRGSSFCGPETEKLTHLDCISVPLQKIQDLHNDGRKMRQHPIIFLHLR